MRQTYIALGALLLGVSLNATAVTADEMVQKNVEARGGAQRLKALQGVRTTVKAKFGSLDADFVRRQKRPGKIREEFILQGLVGIQAHDGVQGWAVTPWQGRKDPDKLSADDSKGLVEESDIEGALVDYQAKGHTVEYLGTEDVDGTEAHKLKLTRANKDFQYLFLDPDFFLLIRAESHQWLRGAEQVSETDFGEYQLVGGIWWPFAYASGAKGSTSKATFAVENIELNPELDDTLFRFPETAVTPAKVQ